MNLNSLPNELQQWYDYHYCLKKVREAGWNLQYVKNKTSEIQLEAIKQNPYAIQFIHNPSEEIQLEAINQDPHAIQYIHNQTFSLIEQALENNINELRYIHWHVLTEEQYQYFKLKYEHQFIT